MLVVVLVVPPLNIQLPQTQPVPGGQLSEEDSQLVVRQVGPIEADHLQVHPMRGQWR